ncbi:hypothetical protein Vafri_4651 [Volvox africanus]|uniref:S-adenosyl-L-methionine-dependent methyltransferase n=1 Tax=Volvox africanus TaxID=51714 RepID=A0A8J4AVM4_9CHLO|nr:hypothetical protein Vafri_4651 [Volvox africanus]
MSTIRAAMFAATLSNPLKHCDESALEHSIIANATSNTGRPSAQTASSGLQTFSDATSSPAPPAIAPLTVPLPVATTCSSKAREAAVAKTGATALIPVSAFTITSTAKSGKGSKNKAHAQIVAFATTAPHNDMLDGAEADFWREDEPGAALAAAMSGATRSHPLTDYRDARGAAATRGGGPDLGGDSGGASKQAKKPSKLAWLRRKVMSMQQLWIWPFTHYKPTNQVMLCYRTLFQDLGLPGANEDYLAAKFRDELMPLRGWLHRNMPKLLHINKAFIQGPAFGCPGIMTYLNARTRWLDEEVSAAIRQGFTQVVVVAAGFDTRAYRLSTPGVSFFEIDLPEASQRKRELVERTLPVDQFPRPTFIAADLSKVSVADVLLGTWPRTQTMASWGAVQGVDATADGYVVKRNGSADSSADSSSTVGTNGASVTAFKSASVSTSATTAVAAAAISPKSAGNSSGGGGFNPRDKTLFTVEGLLYYLPPLAVARLLVSIRAVASPGSRVAFDFLHQDVFSGRRWEPGYETLRLTVRNKGEPKRSGMNPVTLREYLSPMGWRLTYLPTPKEVAAAMYPDRSWSRLNPVLPPFYNFAVAEAD